METRTNFSKQRGKYWLYAAAVVVALAIGFSAALVTLQPSSRPSNDEAQSAAAQPESTFGSSDSENTNSPTPSSDSHEFAARGSANEAQGPRFKRIYIGQPVSELPATIKKGRFGIEYQGNHEGDSFRVMEFPEGTVYQFEVIYANKGISLKSALQQHSLPWTTNPKLAPAQAANGEIWGVVDLGNSIGYEAAGVLGPDAIVTRVVYGARGEYPANLHGEPLGELVKQALLRGQHVNQANTGDAEIVFPVAKWKDPTVEMRERLAQMTGALERNLDAEEEVINRFMADQSKGRDGRSFFCDPRFAVGFFAVRSWEIVDKSTAGIIYTVRVDSSNKGGRPITALWEFTATAKDGKACIAGVKEK